MSRCGCESLPGTSTCSCSVLGVANITMLVTGSGSAADPWLVDHRRTPWINISGTYVNNWSAFAGSTVDVPQYRILWGGRMIELRGRMLHALAFVKAQNMITGIPAEIRPVRKKWMRCTSGGATGNNGMISITPAGEIICEVGPTIGAAYMQLDSVWYEVT